jgi:serine/threonine protein kinase
VVSLLTVANPETFERKLDGSFSNRFEKLLSNPCFLVFKLTSAHFVIEKQGTPGVSPLDRNKLNTPRNASTPSYDPDVSRVLPPPRSAETHNEFSATQAMPSPAVNAQSRPRLEQPLEQQPGISAATVRGGNSYHKHARYFDNMGVIEPEIPSRVSDSSLRYSTQRGFQDSTQPPAQTSSIVSSGKMKIPSRKPVQAGDGNNAAPKEVDAGQLITHSASRPSPSRQASSPKTSKKDASELPVIMHASNTSDRLSSFFPGPACPAKAYTDLEILEISSALKTIDDAWSKVPRTYIVLRTMDRLDLLNDLISFGFSDYWFPVGENSLPKQFDAKLRLKFTSVQDIILTKSMDLEKGENGRHQHFAKGDIIPFESKGILGNGGFGQVDRVLSSISYREYARKLISRREAFGSQPSKVYQGFVEEMKILKSLKHRHIVELVGSYTDPKYLGLLMLPIAQMDLSVYLHVYASERGHELRSFFGCLARALEYLHDNRIRHKDIKPGNILIHNGKALFTDFGLARDFADATGSTTSGITALSPRYCSPEVANYEPRNSSSDIWSLGCVFFEMLVVLKGLTIESMKEFFVQNGTNQPFIRTNFEAFSKLAMGLEATSGAKDNRSLQWVRKMVNLDRTNRPSASDVINSILAPDKYGEIDFSFCGLCCRSGVYSGSSGETDDETDNWVTEEQDPQPGASVSHQ